MAGRKYGLDLGTMNLRIYQSGKGIVSYEKNMIAIQKKKEIVAVGNDAFEMYERTPASIAISQPVRDGVIADIQHMNKLVETLLKKSGCSNGLMRNNYFFFAVPSDVTEVEKRAYFDLIAHSVFNTHNIHVIEKPLAAALGEKLNVNSSRGLMLVDMGAGTTEITVMTMGGIVVSHLLREGGNTMNAAISERVRSEYHLLIGEKTCEYLKLELGQAIPGSGASSRRVVYGRNIVSGLPASAEVADAVVYESMKEYFVHVIRAIRHLMDSIPPELSADILEDGIYFTGGTTLIPGLDKLFSALLKIPVTFSARPLESVVNGLGKVMEQPSEYKNMIFSLREATFE